MANDITTVLTISGPEADVAALMAAHVLPVEGEPERVRLAFRTIVPRPACVDATESGSEADCGFFAVTGLVHVSFAMFGARVPWADGFEVGPMTTPADLKVWLAEHRPDILAKGEAQFACLRETGHREWYEWAHANWGTKWDSYDCEIRERAPCHCVFQVTTANGTGAPVLARLAALFPSLTIGVESVDEGGPEFAGMFTAGAGSIARVDECKERYRRVMRRDPYSDEEEEEADRG